MSDPRATRSASTMLVRAVSGKLFAPDDLGAVIENLYETQEGTLKSVRGPAPLIPGYIGGTAQPTFSSMNGIFHGKLKDGQKEVILATAYGTDPVSGATSRSLLEFRGWNKSWAFSYVYQPADGPSKAPEFPTQFEQCPNGIVVISQHDAQPRFFDEEGHFAPLGYTSPPGAPVLYGPTLGTDITGVADDNFTVNPNNSGGYSHDANVFSPWPWGAQTHTAFGKSRVGTTYSDSTVEGSDYMKPTGNLDSMSGVALANGVTPGLLLGGAYNGAVQYVDKYGNWSPLSPRSDTVYFSQQSTAEPQFINSNITTDYTEKLYAQVPENLLKQLAWQNVSVDTSVSLEAKTIGRNIYRTKDILNSGSSTDLFLLTSYAEGGLFTFATIPDNSSEFYPDNAPDGWLVAKALDVVSMRRFRLCRIGFGRMFFANDPGDPGLVHWSMPGRWGTLLRNDFIYPDPSGGEITGLWPLDAGMLVFTRSSTFLITDTSQETGFALTTLSRTAGCVAPDSIATTQGGVTIWLGADGFYAHNRGAVTYFSEPIRNRVKYVNSSRALQAVGAVDPATGEYRCWVAMDASTENNTCFIYDERPPFTGWRTRSDIKARSVCVTKDHRSYMLAVGTTGSEPAATPYSAYVLDKSVSAAAFSVPARNHIIETTWLLNEKNYDSKTPITVYLWMRETAEQILSVEVYRDWRKVILHTETVSLYNVKDAPPFWGSTALGAGETIRKTRPYWCKAKVFVPSCEVFKFRIIATSKIEFVGMSFDFIPHVAGGARVPR